MIDAFKRHLGWCPNAPMRLQSSRELHEEVVDCIQVQRDGISQPAGRLQRYRNQVLLLAVFFTLAAIPAVAFFQADYITRLMLILGTITGLGFFAFFAPWLWNSFGMLVKGMTIKTGPGDYIISFFIAGIIPCWFIIILGGILAVISIAGALAFPAFATGFAFVPWYVLALILVWEQRTGCILMFDKKTRSFTAARCSCYAYH
ncbi:MAG: DUF1673 family protein [Methanoregula sp.]